MKLDFSRTEFDHLLWDEAWVKYDENAVELVLAPWYQHELIPSEIGRLCAEHF